MPFIQVDINKDNEKHCQESLSFTGVWNGSKEE